MIGIIPDKGIRTGTVAASMTACYRIALVCADLITWPHAIAGRKLRDAFAKHN